MPPQTQFKVANPLALLGWIVLIAAPLAPKAADWIADTFIPLALAVGYGALILPHRAGATGDYGSLAEVMALFTNPQIALAGWVHHLGLDLFVGAWAIRTARVAGIRHLLVVPHLVLNFLFGPAGFFTFPAMVAAFGMTTSVQEICS